LKFNWIPLENLFGFCGLHLAAELMSVSKLTLNLDYSAMVRIVA